MKKWLSQKCSVPNWLILLIAVLSIVSFVVFVAKVQELYVQKDIVEGQLAEAKCILETLDVQTNDMEYFFSCGLHGLHAPPYEVFRFPQIKVGCLSVLGIMAGVAWAIFQNRKK